MPRASRVKFENFGHTTKNEIFRLVKLLADFSTRHTTQILTEMQWFLPYPSIDLKKMPNLTPTNRQKQ